MRSDLVELVCVLDRSGSMANIAADMEGGFNNFIAEQRRQPGEMRVTLHQFDTVHETVYQNCSVHAVPPLRLQPRGGTALLDAVGQAINTTGARLAAMPEHERPCRVIFMILTDGQENSSREFNNKQIKEMIEHQERVYSWTFIFLGANQNAFHEADTIGVKSANTMNFAANSRSSRAVYSNLSGKMSAIRGSGGQAFKSGEFYTAADYNEQTSLGAENNPTTPSQNSTQPAPWQSGN
jgi:hypothetical protein